MKDLVLGVATCARELFAAAGELDAADVPIGLAPESAASSAPAACSVCPPSDRRGRRTTGGYRAAVHRWPPVAVIAKGDSAVPTVSEAGAEAAEAMRALSATTHNVPEPAGALALAGLLQDRQRMLGRRVAIAQTGGNIDTSLRREVLAGGTLLPR